MDASVPLPLPGPVSASVNQPSANMSISTDNVPPPPAIAGNPEDSRVVGASSYVPPQPRFLACLRCRGKKAKCDNIQPVCATCAKAGAECVRPTERRRKRTRREIEEAERLGLHTPRGASQAGGKRAREYDGPTSMARIEGPSSHHQHQRQQQPQQVLYPGHPQLQPLLPMPPTMVYRPENSRSLGSDRPPPQPPPQRPSTQRQQRSGPRMTTQSDAEGAGSEALESMARRVAYLEGAPGEDQTLKVHYYRFSGSTAIHPGFNRITIELRSSNDYSIPALSPTTTPSTSRAMEEYSQDNTLMETFFTYFGQHFPWLQQAKVEERINAGTMSAFLLNAMKALAVRFMKNSRRKPQHYIDAAWDLVVPLLRVPSRDVVGGLLLLAWAEFGENSESGLWNYSGLAIRMGIDLGMHKSEPTSSGEDSMTGVSGGGGGEPHDDVCDAKLLFWGLFIIDRILAFGTGRMVSIREELVEVPLPTQDDMSVATQTSTLSSPFVSIVRLYVLAGRIADILNGTRGRPRTLVNHSTSTAEVLQPLQNQLVEFLSALTPDLHWSVDNFRAHSANFQGGSFLFLHLWAHAILALIHHPNLGKNGTDEESETPLTSSVRRSIKLSLASSRQIVDCLVFADLFDAGSYCATPFVNQCLFIAGVAFIHDSQTEESTGESEGGNSAPVASTSTAESSSGTTRMGAMNVPMDFLNSLVKQNLSAILKALKKMEKYWAGLAYIIDVLEQRASGKGWATVDFNISGDKGQKFISLPDMGILRRVAQKSQSGSSPETSADSNTPLTGVNDPSTIPNWSFDSLLNTYRVEEVTASGETAMDFTFPQGLNW